MCSIMFHTPQMEFFKSIRKCNFITCASSLLPFILNSSPSGHLSSLSLFMSIREQRTSMMEKLKSEEPTITRVEFIKSRKFIWNSVPCSSSRSNWIELSTWTISHDGTSFKMRTLLSFILIEFWFHYDEDYEWNKRKKNYPTQIIQNFNRCYATSLINQPKESELLVFQVFHFDFKFLLHHQKTINQNSINNSKTRGSSPNRKYLIRTSASSSFFYLSKKKNIQIFSKTSKM